MTITKNLILLGMISGFVTTAQAQNETTYPKAEWDKAKVILMHTPGEELFDGVIHPMAGLFEHYFDVDAAADEHRNYIKQLEKNGIKVYNVADILNELDMDTLRALAGKTLTYDISNVNKRDTAACGQVYRQKVLGQMTRKDLIRCLLFQPTVKMRSVDNNTGIEADYIHHSLMNLYFTRDQSITTPRGHIISNMNSAQRLPETRIIRSCYIHLGLSTILEIKGEGRLEGGDYIPAGTFSLIGCGMRTNMEAIRQIMEADAFGHDTIVVVNDHKLWQMQMHLDTYFNIMDKDLCTLVSSRLNAKPDQPEYVTADVYAREHGSKEYRLISKDLPFVDFLKKKGFSIIPINENDELHYANNYLTISPRHVMMVGGQSSELELALKNNGVKAEWIPLENLIDGYGAAHCMTQVLLRESSPTTPTAIKSLHGTNEASDNGDTYDLQGIKVKKNSAGKIHIKNRKKILVGKR